MKKGIVAIVVAVILGLSFILVAKIGSNTAINIKNKGYVTVKGFAKQKITSDYAIFDVEIVAENPLLNNSPLYPFYLTYILLYRYLPY